MNMRFCQEQNSTHKIDPEKSKRTLKHMMFKTCIHYYVFMYLTTFHSMILLRKVSMQHDTTREYAVYAMRQTPFCVSVFNIPQVRTHLVHGIGFIHVCSLLMPQYNMFFHFKTREQLPCLGNHHPTAPHHQPPPPPSSSSPSSSSSSSIIHHPSSIIHHHHHHHQSSIIHHPSSIIIIIINHQSSIINHHHHHHHPSSIIHHHHHHHHHHPSSIIHHPSSIIHLLSGLHFKRVCLKKKY